MATRRAQPFVRHRVTWATYGLLGYFAYLETILGPLMPFLRAERGWGYTVASFHFSAFALGGVLAGALGDRVLARWGRRAGLWGGGAGMAAGALPLVASPVALATILGTLVMGFFGALLLITTQAVLADRHGDWAAVAITESNVAASACAISASVAVGAFAASGLGWRAALAPPLVVLVVLAASFRTEPLGETRRAVRAGDGTAPVLSPLFWTLWGVLFLGVSAEWSIGYWGADFLENAVGLTRSQAATGLSAFFVAMLIGRIAGSRLARVVPPSRLLALSLAVALVGFPGSWLAPNAFVSLLGLFVTGLGAGSVYPLTLSLGVAAAPEGTDTATARLGLAGAGAILLAPFLLGALADRVGIGSAYGIVVPMLAGAVALALLSTRLAATAGATGD
ncbi:hypothetical protein BH24ACT26_BH24ACT26_20610 [soil metagenome]